MSTHPTRSNAALAARANAIAGRGRIIPVADHHTIRLSVESNALLAGVYRCHERTISGSATGFSYRDLRRIFEQSAGVVLPKPEIKRAGGRA